MITDLINHRKWRAEAGGGKGGGEGGGGGGVGGGGGHLQRLHKLTVLLIISEIFTVYHAILVHINRVN